MNKIRGLIEKEIVRTLYQEGIPLTVKEVSQKSGLSLNIVKKYAFQLKQKGVLDMKSKEVNPIQTDFNNLIRIYGLYENIPQEERESFLNCLDPKIRQEIEVALGS